jgi:hypothetical protein
VHAVGSSYAPPAGTGAHDAGIISHLLQLSVTTGTKTALTFSIIMVAIGLGLSFLIPPVPAEVGERAADRLEPVEPIDVDPRLREAHA